MLAQGGCAAHAGKVSGAEPSTANLGNRIFPHLKSAELQFSRIYHLMAKFWPTITLCSRCQSTYMSCNQRVAFSHPLSSFAMRWKKLWWVKLAFPCCARNGTCLIPESCSSDPVAKSPRLAAHSPWPHQTNGHLSICALWQDQHHKYRPWKVGRTLNKLCPKGSGQHQCSEWELTLLWQRLPAQL